MKNKFVKLLAIFSVAFSLLLSGGIFAYWANSVEGDTAQDELEITIGAGQTITTMLSLQESQITQGRLVPMGYETSDSVSQIVVVYQIYLESVEEGSEGASAMLTAAHGVLPNPLLNVYITLSSSQIVAEGASVEVVVTVTLDEPANITEYNSVANMSFLIPITFSAVI